MIKIFVAPKRTLRQRQQIDYNETRIEEQIWNREK